MHPSLSFNNARPRIGRLAALAVASLGLAISGCAALNLRGEALRDNDLSGVCRQLRPRDTTHEAWGVSNKALQIEKDFGYE